MKKFWHGGASLLLAACCVIQSAQAQEVVQGLYMTSAEPEAADGGWRPVQRASWYQTEPVPARRFRTASMQLDPTPAPTEGPLVPEPMLQPAPRAAAPTQRKAQPAPSMLYQEQQPMWEAEEEFDEEPCDEGCGGQGCGIGWDGDCCCGCNHWYYFGPWWLDNLQVFGGTQSFKSQVDRGSASNFGFHEGINWATPLWEPLGLGHASGINVVHSDLSGSQLATSRTQFFYTSQVFYRNPCGFGLQGGVASDYLHDDYYGIADLGQIRGELSFLGGCQGEIGTWVAARTRSDQVAGSRWSPANMYLFFYRWNACNGGSVRFWGGFTDGANLNGGHRNEGVIGSDATIQFCESWALQTNVNYRIPRSEGQRSEYLSESWGMSIQLVWTPGATRSCGGLSPYRPLFNVADNSTFMVNRLAP